MISKKLFLAIVTGVILIGCVITGYSFYLLKNAENNTYYSSQISELQNKIQREKSKIIRLKKEYPKSPDISVLGYYIATIKQLDFLVKGTPEIAGFNVTLLNTNKRLSNKKKKAGLLSRYIERVKGNRYLSKLNFVLTIRLSQDIEKPAKNIPNFYLLYKPLVYMIYLEKNKPLIIKGLEFSTGYYNIYIEIKAKGK